MVWPATAIFILTYAGIALGRLPGLAADRVGIALMGAIAMALFGGTPPQEAVQSIDFPTLLLLYALMVISAQLRLGGFYTWLVARLTFFLSRPRLFLMLLMLTSAFLSALLANDIVCLTFTPVLVVGLISVRLNPIPFLIGLAVASNIGSAATLIGNPQNMFIGQVGRLDFTAFLFWCGPPAIISLFASFFLILWIYRGRLSEQTFLTGDVREMVWPTFDRWQTTKGLVAVGLLIVLFFTAIPREVSAMGIAGLLLCSRKMKTRDMLGLIDWHLLTLFSSLFIIIHAVSRQGVLSAFMAVSAKWGIDIHHPAILTALSAFFSNLVSNVPAVMALVEFLNPGQPEQWYTLALSSTFAGNLILIGSIANLIVVEQAAFFNIRLSFREHAAVGAPVTLVSLLIALVWIAL